jgi:hypothetical protein
MIESNLDGIETLRIVRADGNLRITGAAPARISGSPEPEIEREGGAARITLRGNGELRVPAGMTVEVARVGGNLTAEDLAAPLTIGRVGGNLRADHIGALAVTEGIGGSAYLERAGAVEIESVGGKARIVEASGRVRIAHVGGKLVADGIGGDLSASSVGGHASVERISGAVDLPAVGGAADVRGPFPAAKSWRIRSRGRVSVELDSEASLEINAAAGWGRVRIYGIDVAGLRWDGRNRVTGVLGAERPAGERTTLDLETSSADIIIARPGARPESEARFGRRFAVPFEDLAEELGRDIPGFVSAILGATGKFVADSGALSGEIVRDVTSGVGRGVREVLAEIDRMLDELGDRVPQELAEQLAAACRKLSEMIRRAATETRGQSHEARREMRRKIREAADELRERIREAARAARERAGEERPTEPGVPGAETPAPFPGQTQPLTPEARARDVLAILKAVKAGEIEPDEADDMIAALMEVERVARDNG